MPDPTDDPKPAPPQRVLPPDPNAPPEPPEKHAECGPPRWDGLLYRCPVHGVPLQVNRAPYDGANRPGVHRKAPPVTPPNIPRATVQTDSVVAKLQAQVRELERRNEQLRAQLETTQAELREVIEAAETTEPTAEPADSEGTP